MAAPPSFDDRERLAALRLARGRGVGPVLFRRLIDRYGLPSRALQALPDLAAQTQAKVAAAAPAVAERELQALSGLAGHLLVYGETDYPQTLAVLPDAPAVLSVVGDPAVLHLPCIGIVGARNASINGRRLAGEFAGGLARLGHVVVSGLARGIDTAAHVGALSVEDGVTVAVMAGGLDHIYPRENEALYRRIVETGGAAVAEMALGTEPIARHFPRRNRIVSGLSQGVVVVEAALKSGSLITARLAAEQGREVFAVPGSPGDPRSRGTNGLIRDGAWLTETVDDIVANLPRPTPRPATSRPVTPCPVAPRPAPIRKEAKSIPVEQEISQKIQIDDLGSEIVGLLSAGPTAVDEILRQCQTSPSIVAGVLLDLELEGRLERHPGNAVSLIS